MNWSKSLRFHFLLKSEKMTHFQGVEKFGALSAARGLRYFKRFLSPFHFFQRKNDFSTEKQKKMIVHYSDWSRSLSGTALYR